MPSLADILVDSRQVGQLARAFRALPTDIRHRVIGAALGRVASQVETRIVRFTAKRIDIQQKHVRAVTRSRYNAGAQALVVRMASQWIPLEALGARQTRAGVTVRGRGSYRGAFITTVTRAGISGTHGGHRGVFKRAGATRLPIRKLHGPNPAHDLYRNGDEYLGEAVDGIDDLIMPRVLRELNRALGRLARRG